MTSISCGKPTNLSSIRNKEEQEELGGGG